MLRRLILGAALAALLAVIPAVGQRGPHSRGGVVVRGGFGHANVGVRVGFGPSRFGFRPGGFGTRFVVPVYFGYPSYYAYDPYYTGIVPYAAQPPVVVVQQPAPVYVTPPVSYMTPAPPPAASGPPSPMLIFKDRTVYSVLDYWVAGSQLHFLPSQGAQRVVPLDSLDLEMTRKVNEACNIPFELKQR